MKKFELYIEIIEANKDIIVTSGIPTKSSTSFADTDFGSDSIDVYIGYNS